MFESGRAFYGRSAVFYLVLVLVFPFFQDRATAADDEVSPQLHINHPPGRADARKKTGEGGRRKGTDWRTLDGSGNNRKDTLMGAAFTELARMAGSYYGDGVSSLAGAGRPGPREISNALVAQPSLIRNPAGASDYLWQWGQFIDHDMDLTDGTDPAETADIPVPAGDPYFDPEGTGGMVISFNRSIYDENTGTGTARPRQQLNEITGWIDASMVYGSDEERAAALRRNDGTGKLKTSPGNLLPFNKDGLPNGGGPSDTLFLAGDVRANEQVGLTAMHTLFVREHNRLAGEIAKMHPGWDDERIYQRARQIVGAEIQAVTYNEFLPALLGKNALSRYRGYEPEVDSGIMNEFSTAAFRFGHSALSPVILRLDRRGRVIPEGNLPLRDAFFAPGRITGEGGIAPILRGLANQACQRIDSYIVDDVRNFLFGLPGEGGFDLASLNIQRGRDHGLPGYNDARETLGLPRAERFRDVSSDPEIQARLASVYAAPDDIDLWAGGLAEDPVPGAQVGELFFLIIKTQFEALRDGDRYWYENKLGRDERRKIAKTRLSDIIRRNTAIGDEIPDNVFYAPE